MKITLNLATRPYADQGPALKRLRIGMAVLAVVLAGLGWGLLHFHQSALAAAAREEALDRSIAKIQREQQGYQAQMQQPANAKVLTQAGFLNQLFDEKSFSWTATMEDLEPVLPAGVQVTAIEPVRDKNGDLTLRLRVSGPRERSVEMIRNMEHSHRFVSPRIVGENAENQSAQGDLQPVSVNGKVTFEILAEYSQATLEERKAAIAAEKREHPGAAAASPNTQASPRRPNQPANPGLANGQPLNGRLRTRQLPAQPGLARPGMPLGSPNTIAPNMTHGPRTLPYRPQGTSPNPTAGGPQ